MYLLSKSISVFINSTIKLDGNGLRHFARALTQEQLSVSNQETLTGRILLYLNNDKEQALNTPQSRPDLLQKFRENSNQLSKFNTDEIINFSNVLTKQSLTRNELLLFDTVCYSRLTELRPTDILKLLNVYMNIVPSRITEFKFYKESIKVLHELLPKLNKRDLLQFMFYVGLKKKTPESQSIHRQCMRTMGRNFIDSLTAEELCIICNSSFKTSTKIINKALLEKVRTYINDHLLILQDCALFITLIKTLRHNRYQDDDLLNTISCGVFFNKTFSIYSFPVLCHILALFTDYFYYDEQLFKQFTTQCINELKGSKFVSKRLHLTEQLRGKDIKRFLWILSMFSEMKLVTQSDIKSVIIPTLIERIKAGEFDGDVDSLVDINLFLWMLNYKSHELVPYIFNKVNLRFWAIHPKTNLRLNLLLYAIYVEDPNFSKQLPVKPVSIPSNEFSNYQLHKRPFVERLLNKLNHIKYDLDFSHFELSQEIPHLNIVGITGYKSQTKKAVYVEVLDDYNKIKNVEDDIPVGLMALKLRLLDQLEEGVLVVSQKESEEMTDTEFDDFLSEELKMIC